MRREKLKIITGQPLVLELESLGVEKASTLPDGGVDWRYAVYHKGASYDIYLPVDGHLAVKRSGAEIGDEIELTKARAQDKSIIFQCRRFSDAHLAIEAPTPAPREIRMVAPAPAQPQSQPYTRGAAAPQREPVQQVRPIATVHPLQEMMTRCLEVAYQANQTAYLNLRAQGVEIDAPTWEDVRATGTSFFIQRMREGTR